MSWIWWIVVLCVPPSAGGLSSHHCCVLGASSSLWQVGSVKHHSVESLWMSTCKHISVQWIQAQAVWGRQCEADSVSTGLQQEVCISVCVCFLHCSGSSYPLSAPLLLYSGREPVQEVWWDPAPLSRPHPPPFFNLASLHPPPRDPNPNSSPLLTRCIWVPLHSVLALRENLYWPQCASCSRQCVSIEQFSIGCDSEHGAVSGCDWSRANCHVIWKVKIWKIKQNKPKHNGPFSASTLLLP